MSALNYYESEMRVALRRYEHSWRREWLVRDVDFEYDFRGDQFLLLVRFNSREPNQGYAFNAHEIAMDGPSAFFAWLEVVDRDVRSRSDQFRREEEVERSALLRQMIDNVAMTMPARMISDEGLRTLLQQGLDVPEGFFADAEDKKKADQKARELFRRTAGDEAYRVLESGAPLRVVGSKGTPYLLHKRATYCVERPSDGAKLCAVVPGVPLWDHLLGIKLTIEHDEETFLRTANVSGTRTVRPRDIGFNVATDPALW